ncbi:hypothetical protein Q7P37_008114 [Cladosporium fusiforme]
MPPTAANRKVSLLSTASGDATNTSNVRRTNSGRAVRTNTTRPANYYARPYANHGHEAAMDDSTPAGFFPAITYFTDAITALPKEVMHHFTLMKEVEAKIHRPSERLAEAVDALLEYPVPTRTGTAGGAHGGMLSFTAANSAIGSANVSLVNGVAPYNPNGQDSAAASTTGEDSNMQESEGDLERRKQYHGLRMITHDLLANLDEKNVVLTEANRILNLQMSRLDSVMPHVEEEIPEEARLGSMTHWAYSDNRLKNKPVAPAANERNRRDVALTNSLAAAASAVHETEIAATRRDAIKETGKEKTGRGRNREQLDSEFEERPKKTTGKVGRGKTATAAAAAAAAQATGLGISNVEPVKRRKVDKTVGGTGMERQASTKGKAAKDNTPRSTPAAEPVKKTAKAKAAPPPLTKRKGPNSAAATPVVANSPLQATFNAAQTEAASGRPQSARMTKASNTNLRHERVMDQEDSRPPSVPVKSNGEKSNGEKSNGKKRAREEEQPQQQQQPPPEAAEPAQGESVRETTMKREENELNAPRPAPSRSDSSKKTSGRQSNNGTPRAEDNAGSDTAMARTRSTRSMRNGEPSGSETPFPRANHKRSNHGGSMSGLMRQIAPFNRSPDHGRDEDDPDEDLDSNSDGEPRFRARSARRSKTGSRNVSRHTSSRKRSGNASRERQRPVEDDHGDGDTEMPNVTDDRNVVSSREPNNSPPPAPALTHSPSPSLSSQPPSPTRISPAPQHGAQQTNQSINNGDNDPASSLPPSSPASAARSPVPQSAPQSPRTRAIEAGSEAAGSDEEDPDPDDPMEPKYCYCLRGSYGDMVGCDNPKCEREWFHLGCTDLAYMPGEDESWFCTLCRPRGRGVVGGRGGRGGIGGGRGKRGRGRGRGG